MYLAPYFLSFLDSLLPLLISLFIFHYHLFVLSSFSSFTLSHLSFFSFLSFLFFRFPSIMQSIFLSLPSFSSLSLLFPFPVYYLSFSPFLSSLSLLSFSSLVYHLTSLLSIPSLLFLLISSSICLFLPPASTSFIFIISFILCIYSPFAYHISHLSYHLLRYKP